MNELITDGDWSIIDSALCKVIEFTPNIDNKIKYRASIVFETGEFLDGVIGYIYHNNDFKNLLEAIEMQKKLPESEVLFFWSKKHYKNIIYKAISDFMPRMWIMLCPNDSYNIMRKNHYKPELTGEARYKATLPIKEWKPDVIE